MEFSLPQAQSFINYLHSSGILSEKQKDSLFQDYSQSNNKKLIFTLADFFKKLTPSDSYDLAFRLFNIWDKVKISIQKSEKLEKIQDFDEKNGLSNSKEKADLDFTLGYSWKKTKSLNFKESLKTHKFECIFKSILSKLNRKLIETSFSSIKHYIPNSQHTHKIKNNYINDLEIFKSEILGSQYPSFRQKIILNDEALIEGPRPFNVSPYKNKELKEISNNNEGSLTSQREKEKPFFSNQKKGSASYIHEKLYKEASLKQINSMYFENIRRKNEMDECTFKPNVTKNSNSKNQNKENKSKNSSIFEKLYLEGEQRKQFLDEKQKINEENKLKECTFCPITLKSSIHESKNLERSNKKFIDDKGKKSPFCTSKPRSLSTYEKNSCRSLEIKDPNLINTNNFTSKGTFSTKGEKRDLLQKENKSPLSNSNSRRIKSVYYENDFLFSNKFKSHNH